MPLINGIPVVKFIINVKSFNTRTNGQKEVGYKEMTFDGLALKKPGKEYIDAILFSSRQLKEATNEVHIPLAGCNILARVDVNFDFIKSKIHLRYHDDSHGLGSYVGVLGGKSLDTSEFINVRSNHCNLDYSLVSGKQFGVLQTIVFGSPGIPFRYLVTLSFEILI